MHIAKMRSEEFGLAVKFCRVPDLLIFPTSVSIITLWISSRASAQLHVGLQGTGRCNQTHDLPLNNFYEILERKDNCMLFLLTAEHLFK